MSAQTVKQALKPNALVPGRERHNQKKGTKHQDVTASRIDAGWGVPIAVSVYSAARNVAGMVRILSPRWAPAHHDRCATDCMLLLLTKTGSYIFTIGS